MSVEEVANKFNQSTNLSDDFIISQMIIGELLTQKEKNAADPLHGFSESLDRRATEIYYRHFK